MEVKNSLVNQKETKPATFSSFMTSPAIKARVNAMMSGKKGNQFITSIVSAVTANPALAECEHMSILSSAMQGAAVDLSPSPQLGHFYMVPFNNRKANRKDAQFILGYKGYIQLAIRSGNYKKINIVAIKEGELISFDPLTEEIKVDMIQDEQTREATPTTGYYAMFEYMNGFRKALYWSKSKMEIHADTYSNAFDFKAYQDVKAGKIADKDMWKYSSFWYKDFDAMALKTLIRQLISKWGIMSIEMQQAYEQDNDDQTTEKEPVQAEKSNSVEDSFFEG
jgi:recombination protein RecT